MLNMIMKKGLVFMLMLLMNYSVKMPIPLEMSTTARKNELMMRTYIQITRIVILIKSCDHALLVGVIAIIYIILADTVA